jgi:AcrR family transcriptional regulator
MQPSKAANIVRKEPEVAPISQGFSGNSWQTTKSEMTRAAILEATYNCFVEFGYHNTTTPRIADMANLSRGAMTHHFKSREELIYASVEFLYHKRIGEYEQLMLDATKKYRGKVGVAEDAPAIMNDVVRGVWAYFTLPSYQVHLDLIVASRTDQKMAELIERLNKNAECVVPKLFKKIFPLIPDNNDKLELVFDLLFFTLRGMSISYIHHHQQLRIEQTLQHLAEDCLKIIHLP